MGRQSVSDCLHTWDREGNDGHLMSGCEVNKIQIGSKWLQSEGSGLRGRPIAQPDVDTPLRWLRTWIESHPNPDCLSTSTP
ncbi:hypothetical protein CesoFtcFv8_004282 [Champsocephalus esox]|uniref:Uncharacterized protein n=1 Tax=Champsocephalus esox TaxID=159716 RepID=A0AAN8HFG5_9TELE|nr:hypothetical protein CesoFtcFv8_004282 [Champsocephalus esox]